MDCAVIIPSLNPTEKLLKLVIDLKKNNVNNIIIIDDGSDINNKHIFDQIRKMDIPVITHLVNKGKGAAIKTGIYSITYPVYGYVTADADGQHKVSDILKIINALKDNKDNNIILGQRNFNKGNIPLRSKFGNKMSSIFFKINTLVTCKDTQTGLRGIPSDLKEFLLSTPGERFDFEMNFLIRATKENIKFKNIEIETIYEDNNNCSHFRAIKDSYLIYKQPIKYAISSLMSFLIDILIFTLITKLEAYNDCYNIMYATILARIISGTLNFTLNRKWSFSSKGKISLQMFKYLLLFIIQMFLSSLLVSAFTYTNASLTVIKIIVDSSLFCISYFIQKKYIFRNEENIDV